MPTPTAPVATPPVATIPPASAEEARRALLAGNAAYAAAFAPLAAPPRQRPFAAFLGCSDARAPLEALFGRAANEVFVVRLAGNVLGAEALGSLDYTVTHLDSVRLLGVLGHTGCGAVTAAVDAFLAPTAFLDVVANRALHSIVAGLLPPVDAAAAALRRVHGEAVAARPGYRAALIELSVVLNAALTAAALRRAYTGRPLGVVYSVYDLLTGVAGAPNPAATGDAWQAGLFDAPDGDAAYEALALALAGSRRIVALLD